MPKQLTPEEYAARFEGTTLTQLTPYVNSRHPVKVRCNKCKLEFEFKPFRYTPTTAICAGCDTTTRSGGRVQPLEVCLKRLRFRTDVELVSEYEGMNKKALFRCTKPECRYEWRIRPTNVINHGTGCPACAKIRSQPSYLFPYRKPLKSRLHKKFRVTN